jgi:hypothetical protein
MQPQSPEVAGVRGAWSRASERIPPGVESTTQTSVHKVVSTAGTRAMSFSLMLQLASTIAALS